MPRDPTHSVSPSSGELLTPQGAWSSPRADLPGEPGPSDAPGEPGPEGEPEVLAGRYKLLERIGEGGMGVVWRGYDLDLEEVVAIKFLREDLAGDVSGRVCFRREAKLARLVTHPNVARVYEFGNDRGLYYLTMEYIPGQSLHSVLTRKYSLSPRQVHRCALGLCRGLAAAHAAGIVHGDIKPSNILLSTRRGAVLTDFGIARAVSEVLGKGETVGGTPLYMAPEQILGGVLALQSDIYAAGVVLFECLTGELPWPEVDLAVLLAAKCGPEPDLRARAPGLSDGWYHLISSCLRKDPAQRPANGRVLLAGLREVGAAAGLSTPGPTAHAQRLSAIARQGGHVGDTLDRLAWHPSRGARDDAGSKGEALVFATRQAVGGCPRIDAWSAALRGIDAR